MAQVSPKHPSLSFNYVTITTTTIKKVSISLRVGFRDVFVSRRLNLAGIGCNGGCDCRNYQARTLTSNFLRGDSEDEGFRFTV